MNEKVTLWGQYRKTRIATQLLIIAISLFLMFFTSTPPLTVLIYFAIMQIFAILGAAWSARLRRKMLAAQNRLPLHPR